MKDMKVRTAERVTLHTCGHTVEADTVLTYGLLYPKCPTCGKEGYPFQAKPVNTESEAE